MSRKEYEACDQNSFQLKFRFLNFGSWSKESLIVSILNPPVNNGNRKYNTTCNKQLKVICVQGNEEKGRRSSFFLDFIALFLSLWEIFYA